MKRMLGDLGCWCFILRGYERYNRDIYERDTTETYMREIQQRHI